MAALDNPTIHGVIFDLDGTLLDTEELSTQSLQKCVGKFNKVFTWELKQKILGLPKEGWSPIVIKELGLEGLLSPEDLAEEWEDNFRDMRARLRKCDGAEMVTRRLKELGIPQSIATSSSKGALVIKRQNHEELFQRMEYIVTGDDPKVIKGKPAPDIYLAAASRMGLDPKNCLAFEDALTGVQSAKSAGMFVIAVPDYRLDKKPFWEAGADMVLKSLSEWDPAAFRLEVKNGH